MILACGYRKRPSPTKRKEKYCCRLITVARYCQLRSCYYKDRQIESLASSQRSQRSCMLHRIGSRAFQVHNIHAQFSYDLLFMYTRELNDNMPRQEEEFPFCLRKLRCLHPPKSSTTLNWNNPTQTTNTHTVPVPAARSPTINPSHYVGNHPRRSFPQPPPTYIPILSILSLIFSNPLASDPHIAGGLSGISKSDSKATQFYVIENLTAK